MSETVGYFERQRIKKENEEKFQQSLRQTREAYFDKESDEGKVRMYNRMPKKWKKEILARMSEEERVAFRRKLLTLTVGK
jgi:hypothetical protein